MPQQKFLTRSELMQWLDGYDHADVEIKSVDLQGIRWDRCYSSPQRRALETAQKIYSGEIIVNSALKELDILHLLPERIRLPFMMWGMLVKIRSLMSYQDTEEFKNKISNFLDELFYKQNEQILIVSHRFVMQVMSKELLRRGLVGDSVRFDEYGTLYVYERTGSTR